MALVETSSRRDAPPRPPTGGWWGSGKAPGVRWPGVTIDFRARWVARRGRWETPDGVYYFDRTKPIAPVSSSPSFSRTTLASSPAGRSRSCRISRCCSRSRSSAGSGRATGFGASGSSLPSFPREAGKSPGAAGAGLYLMLCDREPAAEIYALAVDRNQARIVHTNAKVMVEDAPALAEMCEVLARRDLSPGDRARPIRSSSADAREQARLPAARRHLRRVPRPAESRSVRGDQEVDGQAPPAAVDSDHARGHRRRSRSAAKSTTTRRRSSRAPSRIRRVCR